MQEDLVKLDTASGIIESAKVNKIYNDITEINIENDKEYKIALKKQDKIVHFGDGTKIDQKILWVAYIMKQEKGKKGDIFVKDIDKERTYFRAK